MGRTLKERIRDWKWWGEQVLHFAIGFAIVWGGAIVLGAFRVPVAWALPMLIGVSCFAGAAREIIQNDGDPFSKGSREDSLIDVAAWILGAIVAGWT